MRNSGLVLRCELSWESASFPPKTRSSYSLRQFLLYFTKEYYGLSFRDVAGANQAGAR